MKKIARVIIMVIPLFMFGCGICKNNEKKTAESGMPIAKEMIAEGYKLGEISRSSESENCEYTLKLISEENPFLLDPINLEKEYQIDGKKIWVKYQILRMKSRCNNAHPIRILKIQTAE